MDKKKIGACGAVCIAALMYGGAQLMTMESRLEALEGLHPELEGEDEATLHGASDEEPEGGDEPDGDEE